MDARKPKELNEGMKAKEKEKSHKPLRKKYLSK